MIKEKDPSPSFSKLTISEKKNIDIHFRLESKDGDHIDQIEFVCNIQSIFTENTLGRQNVSTTCFGHVVYDYATIEKKYKVLKYVNGNNRLYISKCAKGNFYDSVINIMKYLGYNLGDPKLANDYRYEKYMGLTWKNTVYQFKYIGHSTRLWDKYPEKLSFILPKIEMNK